MSDRRAAGLKDVTVRSIGEIRTGASRLVDAIFFEGLNILRCYEGSFLFSFKDRGEYVMREDEALVIYPRHTVTIEALESRNRLVYGIFDGADAEAYFDQLGFFDCAHGRTESHYGSVMELRSMLESGGKRGELADNAFSLLSDILSTQASEMRRHGDMLVFDAVRQIHRNLKNRVTQMKILCDQLGVSRVQLHRHFVAAGLGAPSDFIRGKQLHLVRDLLENGRLPLAQIAERGGFLSQAHFATFVKRMTGLTPTQIRRGVPILNK